MKMMTDQMEPAMIAWLRFMGYSILLIPLAFWRAGLQALSPPRPVIQIIRGVLLAVGNVSFIICVQYVDFADAIAILYVYPFLMILFAPLVLGETIARSAWIGVIGGVTGVGAQTVDVKRPGQSGITPLMASFRLLKRVPQQSGVTPLMASFRLGWKPQVAQLMRPTKRPAGSPS